MSWGEVLKSINGDPTIPLNVLLKQQGSAEYATPGNYEWTCPKGVTFVYVTAWGGSGGGGGGGGGHGYGSSSSYLYSAATGGGSGAVSDIVKAFIPVVPGTTYNIVVGVGGAGGSGGAISTAYHGSGGDGGVGRDGGDTKFGDSFVVKGGNGGFGGKGGSRTLDNNDSITGDERVSGGAQGTYISSDTKSLNTAGIIQEYLPGKSGSNGSSSAYYATKFQTGKSGGAASVNKFIRSGSGGQGGTCTTSTSSSSLSKGSDGSSGSDGYMKIIW